MTPLPKPRARGIAAQLRRDLKHPGDDTWLPIPSRRVGSAAKCAGLTGRYTARKEEANGVPGVRVWLLPPTETA
jgi:hypothetical protein